MHPIEHVDSSDDNTTKAPSPPHALTENEIFVQIIHPYWNLDHPRVEAIRSGGRGRKCVGSGDWG